MDTKVGVAGLDTEVSRSRYRGVAGQVAGGKPGWIPAWGKPG